MKFKKSLQEILEELKINDEFKENIVTWRTIEEKPAQTCSIARRFASSY